MESPQAEHTVRNAIYGNQPSRHSSDMSLNMAYNSVSASPGGGDGERDEDGEEQDNAYEVIDDTADSVDYEGNMAYGTLQTSPTSDGYSKLQESGQVVTPDGYSKLQESLGAGGGRAEKTVPQPPSEGYSQLSPVRVGAGGQELAKGTRHYDVPKGEEREEGERRKEEQDRHYEVPETVTTPSVPDK